MNLWAVMPLVWALGYIVGILAERHTGRRGRG